MNTQENNTQNSSVHLSTVKELLAQLDLMKNEGIGAQKRLEYIIEHGKEVVPEFDFRDAFDLELEASGQRTTTLTRMDDTLSNLKDQWKSGPFRDVVKDAGQKLLDHLIKFISDAQTQERKTEMQLLSQLWEWAPCLQHLYPWLTEGKKPEPVKEKPELDPETKKLVEAKEKLEAELDEKLKAELNKVADEELLPKKKAYELTEEIVEEQRVVAKVTASVEPVTTFVDGDEGEKIEMPEPEEPTDDQLLVKAWAEALREFTVVPWKFRWHARSDSGIVKTWGNGSDEARLELLEVPTDVTRVTLRLYIKGKAMVHQETIPNIKVKELHEDPMDFVKKTVDG